MDKKYVIGIGKETETSKQIRNIKETLTDIGVIDETTPNDMIPQAIEDGLKKAGEVRKAVDDVKQALIEKGVASEDTPYSEMDEKIKDLKGDSFEVEINMELYDKNPLSSDYDFNYIYITKDGKTMYGSYSDSNKTGIFKVDLETGRHHQIRLQMSNIGHALYGDQRYGLQDKKQLALYSYKLEFIHPVTKEKMTFLNVPKCTSVWKILEGVDI